MKKNMGTADKAIRVLLAIVIAALYFTHTISGIWAMVLVILAVIFVLTSLVGFCPLYLLFGINTCQKRNSNTPR